MNYARQPYEPDWYNSDASKIYVSATAGTSPFNEWYEFDDHNDAMSEMMSFNSQSFVDEMAFVGSDMYYKEDLTFNEETNEYEVTSDDPTKNDYQGAVQLESSF